jgi:hypothetical protein
VRGTVVEVEGTLMPSYRWSRLIAVLCGVGSAVTGTSAWAFQSQPFIEEINNARHGYNPGAWVGESFWNRNGVLESKGEFGPSLGFWQRSADGSPISNDAFPFTKLGTQPGGIVQHGTNGGDLSPQNSQPSYITNNHAFGGNGEARNPLTGNDPANGSQVGNTPNGLPTGQQPFQGPNGAIANPFGPNRPGQFPQQGWNQANSPYGPSQMQMTSANRTQSKVSWALDTTQQPYVGFLGQVTRPGVYEIEGRGVRLADLLSEIGGLARDASGQFRIIRQGRPGLMTSYAGAAQFELMAGDLVIADAQYVSPASNPNAAAATSVQIGFVNLIERPVVLKLRREHASLVEILALMRQDESLASQVKIITPANQRSAGSMQLGTPLPSETVLIFPLNAVRAARLAPLPEPFKLKRDGEDATSQPQPTPRANISPDVSQLPRSQPSVGAWQDSQPLPQAARAVSQPSREPDVIEAPPPPVEAANTKRVGGVRQTPQGQDLIARDSQMVLAPPAESNDRAPVPEPLFTDDVSDEPSLLKAHGQRRPILLAQEQLDDLGLNDLETKSDQAGSSWSIWPPILTAGAGLLALFGFSLSLRRRTRESHSIPVVPPVVTVTPKSNTPKLARHDELEELIHDQLPLTEERVPLASPMQFHGRPQPPRTIRLDQSHSLPKPHLQESGVRGQGAEIRVQESAVIDQKSDVRPAVPVAPKPASKSAASATQKFRIDRSGATGTGTQILSAAGPLDRALSAVQKQNHPTREERDA